MRRALQQYKAFNLEAEISSASPYRITQMLFEGCLRFLKQAQIAISNGDYEAKSVFISKSMSIISSLSATVDLSANEELGNNLISLYDYCLESLIEASLNMDVNKVEVVYKIIFDIKSGWDQIPAEEVLKSELLRRS